jgi:hypothetical protein
VDALALQQLCTSRQQDRGEISAQHGCCVVEATITIEFEDVKAKGMGESFSGCAGRLITTDGGRNPRRHLASLFLPGEGHQGMKAADYWMRLQGIQAHCARGVEQCSTIGNGLGHCGD